jgi:hypothetical protein
MIVRYKGNHSLPVMMNLEHFPTIEIAPSGTKDCYFVCIPLVDARPDEAELLGFFRGTLEECEAVFNAIAEAYEDDLNYVDISGFPYTEFLDNNDEPLATKDQIKHLETLLGADSSEGDRI